MKDGPKNTDKTDTISTTLHEAKGNGSSIAAITIDVIAFDLLIGKNFRTLELLGLTDRQLAALKSTLRDDCWDWYNAHMENPSGLADPSLRARQAAGIEHAVTYHLSN